MSKDVLPARSQCRVKCSTDFETVQARQNVIFSPYPADSELEMLDSLLQVKLGNRGVHVVVSNPTDQPITLKKGTVLGSVESISAMVPVGPPLQKVSDPHVSNGAMFSEQVDVNVVGQEEQPVDILSQIAASGYPFSNRFVASDR